MADSSHGIYAGLLRHRVGIQVVSPPLTGVAEAPGEIEGPRRSKNGFHRSGNASCFLGIGASWSFFGRGRSRGTVPRYRRTSCSMAYVIEYCYEINEFRCLLCGASMALDNIII